MITFRRYAQVLALVIAGAAVVLSTGCSVARDQQSFGSYIDDTALTAEVKAQLAGNKEVSATAISVESMKGVVQLSGFAKSQAEKNRAEELARQVKGVVGVQNNLIVR